MRVSSPAIEWVRVVADRLGPLRSEVVFLGGAAIALLLTDPAAPSDTECTAAKAWLE